MADKAPGVAPRGSILAAPSFAVGIGLAIAPVAVVLQSKAMAPVGLIALGFAVAADWRRHGTLPRQGRAALWLALALAAWGMLSALWAPEPWRAVEMGAVVAAMALLAAAAAGAVARDAPEARTVMARLAFWGLAAGLAVAALDDVTGNSVRAFVRGIREAPATLAYGLKPAGSVMAMLLPLAAAAPVAAWLRAAVLVLGASVVLMLPGDSAKIAALAGMAALALAWRWPRRAPVLAGSGLAVTVVLMPLLMSAALSGGLQGERIPFSATHRLLIWDFTTSRIAERPLFGWGMEASRTIPGGRDAASAEALDRFAIHSPAWRYALSLPQMQMMPLHPHNGALQVWLELGVVGAVLAGALLVLLGRAARAAPHPPAATGALVAAFVTGMLSFGLWQPWWITAQLLALVGLAGMPERRG